ncbi:putative ubiquitin carboxyl-terminal hydrolase 50 isoform X2 [Ostrea edulis]|uniref:putative ubiquitin carboxyl-terminal hydrolase 50 isoform X2 n=1 Tax=Ostrea edulis TaxID=37623 RepID=UPI0024AFDA53|nr:putative ubiquitin carboxyl-terminal hydrolase 50 isoform X2 [Ostrea edulis]
MEGKKKTKCDSCGENFAYSKDKINCASRKIACAFCDDIIKGWCMELGCHHVVCNGCTNISRECSLCSQRDEVRNRQRVYAKDQDILRDGDYVKDTNLDLSTDCQSCHRNKGEVQLSLCSHVVCLDCLRNPAEHEETIINCPLHNICQETYPSNALAPFQPQADAGQIFGMPSVGLTCYASCMLQVLCSTNCFVRFLERNAPKKDTCTDLLLEILTKNSEKKQDILHLLVYLQSIDGTFDPYNQNDCMSFLHVLLDVLGRDEYTNGCGGYFFADVVDEIECRECMDKEEIGFQRVLGINALIEISETFDMNDLYGEELFENGPLNCRHCAKNRKLAKTTKLANCPAVLLFQIQRICDDGKGFVKRTCDIRFSLDLRVVSRSEGNDSRMCEYSLYAAVYHSGDIEGGHYYCAVKRGIQWYICDNDHIWKCYDKSEILKFGDVYLLFYERK